MPLSIADAERTLSLLWEFKQYAEEEESDIALNTAISLLTGFCSEILPAVARCQAGVQSVGAARSNVVELECNPVERLGICLDVASPQYSAAYSQTLIMISLIKPGSVAHKSGLLNAGDQVVKINGHSLTWASLRRARWILDTAHRSGKVILDVISSALTSNLKHSRTLPPSPFTLDPPPAKRFKQGEDSNVNALIENASIRQSARSFTSKRSSTSSIHNHPSYAPSIGSRRSSQIAITNTVEVAAHIARESVTPSGSGLLLGIPKKKKVRKIHIMKGSRPLGLTVIGGKGSKYGDIGIFIRDIVADGAAHRDGRLKVHDELLMANGRSLIGLTHKEAVAVLKSMPATVQLVVATESLHPSGQTSLCSSRFSLSSIQERYISNSVSPLANHNLSIPEKSSNVAIRDDNTDFKGTAASSSNNQSIPHSVLDTGDEDDDVFSPKQRVFSKDLVPAAASQALQSPPTDDTRHKSSMDSPDFGFKKDKSSSGGTLKKLNIFSHKGSKKKKSKDSSASISKDGDGNDLEMMQMELSLGAPLDEAETSTQTMSDEQMDNQRSSLSPSGMSGDLEMVTPWARMSGANLVQGTLPPSPPIKRVVIPRSQGKKLGIALGQLKNGSGPPFVKNLDPDGLVAKDGRVSIGSNIMKVNNEPLTNCTAKDAAVIIRNEFNKYGLVSLTVSGRRKTSDASPLTKGRSLTIQLTKDPHSGLGIELAKLSTNENDYDIVIQRVISVENVKHIQRGDQILEVDGISLVGITADNVTKIFAKLKPGIVTVKILRPRDLSGIIRELDKISTKSPTSPASPSPLLTSVKNKDIVQPDSDEPLDAHHGSKPSSSKPDNKKSSISRHSSMPDSKKSPLLQTPISNLQESQFMSSSGSGINMNNVDILRRLHRHPSIDSVKREVIEFEKGSGRMGIEVVAGDNTPHKGALVTRVFPDCIASLEGKLKCGDEILKINNRSIIGMPHSEVINLLKQCKGQVTMLVSRSSQVLSSCSGSETSLLDDFFNAEKQKSANTSVVEIEMEPSSSVPFGQEIKTEEFSEDELDEAPRIIKQSPSGGTEDFITVRYSDSSILSSGNRNSILWEKDEESLPPLPSCPPPEHDYSIHVSSIEPAKDVEVVLSPSEEIDGPPMGYSIIMLEIPKIPKGKLTIVPSQKLQEGYFMVRRFVAGSLKEKGLKPGDILVSLNGLPLYGITHAKVLETLGDAPKPSKVEVYRDPEYNIDSLYSPRSSYAAGSRASYAGSRSSLVSLDDSPLQSRKGSLTDFGNRDSSRRSSGYEPKLYGSRRTSEVYDQTTTGSLKRHSSHIPQQPSSLSSFASISTITAKDPSKLTLDLPSTSLPPESSPVATHQSSDRSSPVTPIDPFTRQPINVLPSDDDGIEAGSEDNEDEVFTVKSSTTETPPPPTSTMKVETTATIQDAVTSMKVAETIAAPPTMGVESTVVMRDNAMSKKVAEKIIMERKRPASIVFGSRSEMGPFEVEIIKGFWGLGLTVGCDDAGSIFIKAITSRSPVIKDGNIKVGDHLISINGDVLKSVGETEKILKKLPKGPVKIVAMCPPTEVACDNNWTRYILSSNEESDDSGNGIITVEFNRPKSILLGINVAGGCDTAHSMVFIQSIIPDSLADKCDKFRVGDEIVVAGDELMIGVTNQAAIDKLQELLGLFKIVVQRKKDAEQELNDRPKLARAVTQNSFDSESGDELLLKQEETQADNQIANSAQDKPKLACAVTQESFDSQSGDELLLKQEEKLDTQPSVKAPSDKPKLARMITQNSFDSQSGDELVLEQEEAPKALPDTQATTVCFPEKPKLARTVTQNSFDSESGDELLLKQEEELGTLPDTKATTNHLPDKPKLARTVTQNSFDSESGDELLLKQEEELGTLPDTKAATNHLPDKPKLACTITQNSFDSQSGDELFLEQEEALKALPDTDSKTNHSPDNRKKDDQTSDKPKQTRMVTQNSFDSQSGDKLLLQQEETLGSLPDGTQPATNHLPDKLKFARSMTQNSFDSQGGDELLLEQEEALGPLPNHIHNHPTEQANYSDSENEDEPTTTEEFTVVFHKNESSKLGITVTEDIDTSNGIGVKQIKRGTLAELDGRIQPGNKLLSVNEISLRGMTYKKALEVLRNTGSEIKIVATRTVSRRKMLERTSTAQSSVDDLSNSDNDEPTESVNRPTETVGVGEERFTVEYYKKPNTKLGITIAGGIDTPTGDVGVKQIVKGSLADLDGRLQKGNKLISVNGISLCNVTNKRALEILRSTGNDITIVAVRYVGVAKLKGTPLSSAAASLAGSCNQSPRSSRKMLPEIPTPHRKMSKHYRPGRKTSDSTSSLHESGHHTLPRDFGTVKAIEIRKGAQGLGMQLIGGVDTKRPVKVKQVFEGGAAHQSGKIQKGDQILEVNGKSFANLTHREVIELIKNEPEGKMTLLVKFATKPTR